MTNTKTATVKATDSIRERIAKIPNTTLRASATRIADAMDKGDDAYYRIAFELTHVNAWGCSDSSPQGAYKSVRAYASDVFDMPDNKASEYERIGRFVDRVGSKCVLDERFAMLTNTAILELVRYYRASKSKGDIRDVTAKFMQDNSITGATRCADIRKAVDKALGKDTTDEKEQSASGSEPAEKSVSVELDKINEKISALRALLSTDEQVEALNSLATCIIETIVK